MPGRRSLRSARGKKPAAKKPAKKPATKKRPAKKPAKKPPATRRRVRTRAAAASAEAEAPVLSWRALPPELLLRCLAQLGGEADLRSCHAVCKVWLAACRRDTFWRPLCLNTWARNRPDIAPGCWSSCYLKRKLLDDGTATLPAGLREKELPTTPWYPGDTPDRSVEAGPAPNIPGQFNKIFSCAWADDRVLLAGTKDNKLVRWSFDRHFGMRERDLITMPDPYPSMNSAQGITAAPAKGGLHAIEFNRQFGGAQIACGGNNPNNVVVMDYPSMAPRMQLVGNGDWMFNCCWIDRDRMVSCSRDRTVRVWSTQESDLERATQSENGYPPALLPARQPMLTRAEHLDKIRDMRFNAYTKQIATMSTDGGVRIWDTSNFDVVADLMSPHSSDLVCMACDELLSDQLVLGSRKHITFFDPRIPAMTFAENVPNGDSGVRSLSFRQHVVTVGCGGGQLLFYDTRMSSFRMGGPGQLRAGKGWIRQDDNYKFMFPEDTANSPAGGPASPKNAIYTHAYNDTGSVLFTGGGPLQVGLFGCYGALWSNDRSIA